MKKDIKDVFKEHLGHIEFDKKLYKELFKFRMRWANKNVDTIEFLGGNLLGVNPIRFTASEDEEFFMDILKVDTHELKLDLHALPDIYPERSVTSNVFYLTIAYLAHAFTTSTHIGKNRDEAIQEVYYIFAYKVMSGRMAHYFKYDVDRSTAIAVNERLSNKFLIKKLGSWQAVFEHRSLALLQPKGLHAERVVTLTTDDATRIVMDIQGRIRETVKNIYAVLIEVNEENERIKSTTLDRQEEDDVAIGDIVDRPDVYVKYINSIVYNRNDFLKDDLMYVISDLLNMPNSKDLNTTLDYLSTHFLEHSEDVDFVIDSSVNLSIEYLSKQKVLHGYEADLKSILIMLKNYYTGSRVENKVMDKMKKALKKIYKKSTGKRNKTAISNTSVGVILYIFLRAVVKNTYD